tara:strand:+ start:1105 stop:1449 length:345 start_codon:yes stop_codon:yes gene_type:complete
MMIARDLKRKKRVRFKVRNVNKGRPRLTVFRSAKNIYAQVIDDDKRITLASASSIEKNIEKKSKKELSELVGNLIAERCIKKGCKEVYFDRGKYKYHGRVKQLAESAKRGGLKF